MKKTRLGIIPARYASSRFPGKPLVDIQGKTMIQRVYEQCIKTNALDFCYVATDDMRIFNTVQAFEGKVVMTSEKHPSGTDRCNEAVDIIEDIEKTSIDICVNIQGDEPFIQPKQIELAIACFDNAETEIATLVKKQKVDDSLQNPNSIKVVLNKQKRALYFSRFPIPYYRNHAQIEEEDFYYYKHIGMYAYKKEILKAIAKLPPSHLEKAESLEQLRWLENGYNIQ
ncbi:MAG TPA: 3-deoxy-manno-octulosonate cytidylyltransferase, partial [Bacteroidetes bacterium]|nr:3-deoxy-manno-octulosonate cytidylyltransferase [Bacteroidota bacterium]